MGSKSSKIVPLTDQAAEAQLSSAERAAFRSDVATKALATKPGEQGLVVLAKAQSALQKETGGGAEGTSSAGDASPEHS